MIDNGTSKLKRGVHVVALVKGQERYVIMFDLDRERDALKRIGSMAADPELSFGWFDAAILSSKIRNACKKPSQ